MSNPQLTILAIVLLVAISSAAAIGQDATPGKTVRLNGMEMYYEVHGTGEPLVLLHGFFQTGHRGWDPFLNDLSAKFQVILPDMRGHGRSTNPQETFSHRQSAKDIYALMDHLGIKQFHAMGISSGGMTMLHMATAEPERVRTMVLIGATHYFGKDARRYCGAVSEDGDSLNLGDFIQDEEMRMFHMHGDEQIRKLRRNFNAFSRSYDDMNFTAPYLSTITAKTLIIHGDRDEFFPVEIPVEMYRSIPNASLWIVPNGGHVPIYDESIPFVQHVTRFIMEANLGD